MIRIIIGKKPYEWSKPRHRYHYVMNPTSNGKGIVLTTDENRIWSLECQTIAQFGVCQWIDACPKAPITRNGFIIAYENTCKGVETVITRQSYIFQVVYN